MTIVLVMHKKHSPQATHMCRATSLTGLPRVATLARNDKRAGIPVIETVVFSPLLAPLSLRGMK